MKLTVRRREAYLNTIPPRQSVVEIMDGARVVALMGSWTLLCLAEGAIPATKATDEQVLRAFTHDESVFGR